MRGFKNLTDNRKLNKKPDRIRIRKTVRRMSLKEALASFGVNNDDLEQHALLNGAKELNENIAANSLLKIVEKGQ